MDDEKWMRAAIEQALLAEEMDEVPIGAVIVRDGALIAAAHNTRETDKNPLCHAEVSALSLIHISRICKRLGSHCELG